MPYVKVTLRHCWSPTNNIYCFLSFNIITVLKLKLLVSDQQGQRIQHSSIPSSSIPSSSVPYSFPRTFNASLNPLPSKLKASTNNMIAMPGARASIGLCVMMKL